MFDCAMKRDLVADYTALLAGTEIGVGSLIHGFHIPFGGHLLSLNQGILLTLLSKKSHSAASASRRANYVSLNSAVLKSLAPAGKKLTPMLALAVQGALFSTGMLFGRNVIGVSFGFILLSLWGFIQPLLIYYLFFGQSLFQGILKIWMEIAAVLGILPELGIWVVSAFIAFKIFIGIALGCFIWSRSADFEQEYLKKFVKAGEPVTPKLNFSPAAGALRDILNPVFLLSLVVSGGFLYFYESQNVWIYALRPLAVGYIFFWIGRKISGTKFVSRYPSLELALEKLNQRSRT
jgi:hypothetical protein